jgi:hypothetical protein
VKEHDVIWLRSHWIYLVEPVALIIFATGVGVAFTPPWFAIPMCIVIFGAGTWFAVAPFRVGARLDGSRLTVVPLIGRASTYRLADIDSTAIDDVDSKIVFQVFAPVLALRDGTRQVLWGLAVPGWSAPWDRQIHRHVRRIEEARASAAT